MLKPIWKGYITFGLINIPVILYPAEKKFDIQFKLIDSRDKARVRYVRINEQTGEEVAWTDVAKAYEYDENNYLLLERADVEAISGIHSKTIDIASFVDQNSIDKMVFEKPYYLVPDKKQAKAYVLLREVLKKTNKVGIAKIIIHTREYLAALSPYKNALILNLLRYHQELRESSEFKLPTHNLNSYKISSKEFAMAKQLVDGMTGKWNLKDYQDVFRETLAKWAAKQIQPKKVFNKKAKTITKRINIIDLVDLLKKSINKHKQRLSKKRVK